MSVDHEAFRLLVEACGCLEAAGASSARAAASRAAAAAANPCCSKGDRLVSELMHSAAKMGQGSVSTDLEGLKERLFSACPYGCVTQPQPSSNTGFTHLVIRRLHSAI